jgi:DNA-binding IclR family transcriptional regulator
VTTAELDLAPLRSVSIAMGVLGCFERAAELGATAVATELGIAKSTACRMLAALAASGMLERTPSGRYRLGLRLFEFGNIVLANLELHREGRAVVDALHRLTARAVHLAVFDGLRAVVIQRTEAQTDGGLANTLFENSPAYCTSVGKAILAYQPPETVARVIEAGLERYTETTITEPEALQRELELTRQRGYAIDESEHQPGLRCIGAPIRDQSGQVFAAISVSAPAWQLPLSEVDDLNKVVIYHANLISQRLGYVR